MGLSRNIADALLHGVPEAIIHWSERLRSRIRTRPEWNDLNEIAWFYRLPLRLRQILIGDNYAYQRGLRLLLENLSPRQREDLKRRCYFDVVGGKTGRRYRICWGRQMNVSELDDQSRRVCMWCFQPAGNLVVGDVLMAQKLALELFEDEALASANRIAWSCEPAKIWCR